MQNMHTHAWDQKIHFDPQTVRETEIARGGPIDLTVRFDDFMRDMAPFDRVIVFGLKARRTGYWVPDDYIADFAAKAPDKLIGFASCDPTQPGYVDDLQYAVEQLHLRGVKMGPIYAGFDPRDPRAYLACEYCQMKGIPVIFHTGTTYNRDAPLGLSRPWLFDEVAMRFPDLRIVLAHLGHPFYEECLVVIRKHPNLYADISALFYRPWQFYNMMILAQEYKVTHKLLFGTDYPIVKTQESLDGVRNPNRVIGDAPLPRVSKEVIDQILERDAVKLLGIPP